MTPCTRVEDEQQGRALRMTGLVFSIYKMKSSSSLSLLFQALH